MKMREKIKLKTIEEIPLEELESQSLVEGELLMAVIFNAANYMHHIICSNMLHMICSISYAIYDFSTCHGSSDGHMICLYIKMPI